MSGRQNAANPKGIRGRRFVNKMNTGAHAELSEWGRSFLTLTDYSEMLELGCGGGANVARLLQDSPEARVTGVDYSNVSVRTSRRENAQAIREGRCEIRKENVQELPFDDGVFDLATAFETIYFWPDLPGAFAQVCRVLAEGGTFFICNETDGEDEAGYQWAQEIEGMRIYTIDEVVDLLKQAGFGQVTVQRNPKRHWVCFTAEKGGVCRT